MECKHCGKKLRDDRFEYCDIDCRKAEKLSFEGKRKIPIKIQNPKYNKENYMNSSITLKKLHKEYGHLVNVP